MKITTRLALGLAMTASLIAGCSSSDDDGDGRAHPVASGRFDTLTPDESATTALRLAVDRTTRQAVRFASVQRTSISGVGAADGSSVVTVHGSYDLAKQRGNETLEVRAGGETGRIEARALPDAIYERALPSGKWRAIRRDQLESRWLYVGPAGVPEFVLELLRSVNNAHRLGHDDIRGAQAAHYAGYADRYALVKHLEQAVLDQWGEIVDSAGPSARRIDAWVDTQGRVVRVALGFRAKEGAKRFECSATTDFDAFGTAVTVTRPDVHEPA